MHTLEQLRSGALAGIRRLDLSAELTQLPDEIFDLADSLEVLNLSGNRLSELPDGLARLKKLRVLFCSDNAFTAVPEVLGECEALEMVGFKANRIRHLPDNALPPALRWLILTDNALPSLPRELGARPRLRKLMLSGNRLVGLPESLAECAELELLRIAANQLAALPPWLLQLPRLAWLAFAGNPFSDAWEHASATARPLGRIPAESVRLGERLGEGASGVIYAADWLDGDSEMPVALKRFKGSMTSDGLPRCEIAASLTAGRHAHLVSMIGALETHGDERPALLMERLAPSFRALAGPPSLESCTRDVYPHGQRYPAGTVLRIARGVSAAAGHLHGKGVLHGDLYAHNLLVEDRGHCLLSDFGAASFFDAASKDGMRLQRIEARSFGVLLGELIDRLDERVDTALPQALRALQHECETPQVLDRPDFRTLCARLDRLAADVAPAV